MRKHSKAERESYADMLIRARCIAERQAAGGAQMTDDEAATFPPDVADSIRRCEGGALDAGSTR